MSYQCDRKLEIRFKWTQAQIVVYVTEDKNPTGNNKSNKK